MEPAANAALRDAGDGFTPDSCDEKLTARRATASRFASSFPTCALPWRFSRFSWKTIDGFERCLKVRALFSVDANGPTNIQYKEAMAHGCTWRELLAKTRRMLSKKRKMRRVAPQGHRCLRTLGAETPRSWGTASDRPLTYSPLLESGRHLKIRFMASSHTLFRVRETPAARIVVASVIQP